MLQPAQRRSGIEDQPGFAALVSYQTQRAIDVPARFRVEGYVGGARFREIGDDAIDRLDHQVDVDRRLDAIFAKRFADERTDRQIRHEVIVHDIEMHDIRACIQNGLYILAEPRKVG